MAQLTWSHILHDLHNHLASGWFVEKWRLTAAQAEMLEGACQPAAHLQLHVSVVEAMYCAFTECHRTCKNQQGSGKFQKTDRAAESAWKSSAVVTYMASVLFCAKQLSDVSRQHASCFAQITIDGLFSL